MTSSSDSDDSVDSELLQCQTDLHELKEQVKRLKAAETSYASELAAFRSNNQRLSKYFYGLSKAKRTAKVAQEISDVLEGIKRTRPVKAHWLLSVVLGNHLTYKLLTSGDQLAYKKDYEQFKISVTIGHLILSALGLVFVMRGYSVFYDGVVPLYSVIAYWTMIGREVVLKMNGSNIRGWWFAHHFLSMFLSGLMIIWDKKSEGYPLVRLPLFCFYFYLGAVQVLQYRYQMSRLYALRSLSRVDPMETTNELSQNLIHHNLLFLLPFLLIAYAAEFYLARLIWVNRSGLDSLAIAAVYFVLAVGNTLTTCYTYYKKMMMTAGSKSKSSRNIGAGGEGANMGHLLIRQFTKSAEDLSKKDE